MSNLVFEPKWNASINQVEAGEEIRGGVDGTANIATKQLAENIFYLKDNMYSLVGYIPPDLTDDVQEIIQSKNQIRHKIYENKLSVTLCCAPGRCKIL